MGIFDIIKKEGAQYLRDAAPGGLLNRELTAKALRPVAEVASMTPTPMGDLASGLLAMDDLRNKQYGSAALNAVGLLPFVPGLAGHIVYHGSPHKFDKFDMSKIGTGEGAQAFGRGLYFAENPNIAKSYQDKLSNPVGASAVKGYGSNRKNWFLVGGDNALVGGPFPTKKSANEWINTGALYKVDIPDESIPHMLDWDKPLSEQTEFVRNAVGGLGKYAEPRYETRPSNYGTWVWDTNKKAGHKHIDGFPKQSADAAQKMVDELNAIGPTGSDIYRDLSGGNTFPYIHEQAVQATELLKNAGIPGIRYLDGSSRVYGNGSSNFVLFDDALAKILEINGKPTGMLP